MRTYWGVDSSKKVTRQLYECVKNNYGKPSFWGRYLTRVEDASAGLTTEEIEMLRGYGIKIMPIYNAFSNAVGYDKGKVVARNAAFHARRLGIPKGTPVFVNVEKFFEVDSAWIRGYVDGMYVANYKVGIYHDPVNGDFRPAYCQAVKESDQVALQSILWSAEPEPGITTKRKAPSYAPAKPPCKANVWGWQYGRDDNTCGIDTNLIDSRLYETL
ncbi:DUF1906 domain-containing protein [Bacillus carboniphilus]|uniref:DUF1906 domain-containing protein n=1 Tax=Bacillus carboniphilus TaxID=86663 RepID=A0ABY9JVS8_9BACI|nr:glycoside hydrolase domain-containing protein [Bacillus carboniphilus]WLR41791.1 DUF1906 domain-containing protein [Bacillus carboniphilus]